jgi:nucleoside-diphosphate-sugar epimerase
MSDVLNMHDDMSPSNYIEKVSLPSGEVLNEEILPKQLLVHNHRDYHIVDVQARLLMGRIVRTTGDEERARNVMRGLRKLGYKATDMLAKVVGKANANTVSKALLGLKHREYYFRYKTPDLAPEEIEKRLARLQEEGKAQFAAICSDGQPALRVLLTGGTGFLGQEILYRAAQDDAIKEVVVLIRPKDIIDRKTKQVVRTLSPAERGADLLKRLWLDTPEQQAKFRFIAGDIEQPRFGVSPEDHAELAHTITHVIHCAASVAFDDPYEKSFRVNVTGTLNALDFSLGLQATKDSPFVAHIGIETSYIHGRQVRLSGREDEVIFPRNFYNNYYELTKAMASMETERFMFEKGLRVVQLCPAIVIGDSRTGKNYGDTKVVNAPVNLFGRAHQALTEAKGNVVERSTGAILARMACIFPADPSAQLNLIPVDWVVMGILAALRKPDAVSERIQLATDNRLSSDEIRRTVQEELNVDVKFAEPTLHRNVTLPILTRSLRTMHQEKVAYALDKLSTIFGSYSEWGQPIHEVGKDVKILGLQEPRPNTKHAFRMLCRHNRYVQEFGQVRDLDEISRRERVWQAFIEDLEKRTGQPVNSMPADAFRKALEEGLDLKTFELKSK